MSWSDRYNPWVRDAVQRLAISPVVEVRRVMALQMPGIAAAFTPDLCCQHLTG